MDSGTILISAIALAVYILFGVGLLYFKSMLKNDKRMTKILLTVFLFSFFGGVILLGLALHNL